MKRLFIAVVASLLVTHTALAELVGEEVSYSAGGTTMKGYIVYDNTIPKRRAGVLVVHEWWGHNDYARIRARQLAKLGYTAMALDMYGDGKQADHPQDAAKFSTAVRSNMPLMKERFEAAMKVLKDHDTVLNTRIAAIGYCFGGAVVLEMARQGEKLKGVVSFHGTLSTEQPARKGKVRAKVLVLNGEADPFVSPDSIAAFKAEMDQAKVDYQFISYPGAKHAFTNPAADSLGQQFNLPLAYDQAAEEKSWQEMKRFLAKLL